MICVYVIIVLSCFCAGFIKFCILQERHTVFEGLYCICGVISSPVMALKAGSATDLGDSLTVY
jgi:hypothetical protein